MFKEIIIICQNSYLGELLQFLSCFDLDLPQQPQGESRVTLDMLPVYQVQPKERTPYSHVRTYGWSRIYS